jgi:hypothetical protein
MAKLLAYAPRTPEGINENPEVQVTEVAPTRALEVYHRDRRPHVANPASPRTCEAQRTECLSYHAGDSIWKRYWHLHSLRRPQLWSSTSASGAKAARAYVSGILAAQCVNRLPDLQEGLLKENNIPVDARGRPELSGYTDSAAYYAAMHDQGLRAMEFARRVHGTWGLIAKGAESIPHALAMLRSKDSDAREDGAAVLGEIGKNGEVVEELLSALASELDTQARDSVILALGRMRNRGAIPALAALIEDESTDGDTRWTAVESLGRIVQKRFLAQPEPVAAAVTWLKRHPRR